MLDFWLLITEPTGVACLLSLLIITFIWMFK